MNNEKNNVKFIWLTNKKEHDVLTQDFIKAIFFQNNYQSNGSFLYVKKHNKIKNRLYNQFIFD